MNGFDVALSPARRRGRSRPASRTRRSGCRRPPGLPSAGRAAPTGNTQGHIRRTAVTARCATRPSHANTADPNRLPTRASRLTFRSLAPSRTRRFPVPAARSVVAISSRSGVTLLGMAVRRRWSWCGFDEFGRGPCGSGGPGHWAWVRLRWCSYYCALRVSAVIASSRLVWAIVGSVR